MMQTETRPEFASDEMCWQAVLERDPAADGVFYYAVETTGVYCRPTCPARRPNRANVHYFSAPDAAEAAGFRACLRCRPGAVSAEQQLVAQVQGLLDAVEPSPTLAELGRQVGVSPSHLQRVFRRATGLSPREYAASRRVQQLKAQLQRGTTVTEALYEAGYGSSRALYDGATAQLGMSPGRYRRGGAGETIAYAVLDSPLGRMLLAATRQGICALHFGDDAALVAELRAEFPHADLVEDPTAVAEYAQAVLDHLAAQRPALDLPLDARGTDFQRRVWAALRAIPRGETRTYQQVAFAIGEPTAVRAVARACAANPVAVLVPCHRVHRTDGGLGGYRSGLERKRALLAGERTAARPAVRGGV
jgi:AraC family transcriptional regulator of adaptative response/methylated-DNA-[protein]-cysteine methyltransferase